MPAKTQSKRRRTSRARRTCKKGKGGMFRAASAATGQVVNKVMGKGFDRADKAKFPERLVRRHYRHIA